MKLQVISKRWATIIVYGFLVAIFLEALSYVKATKELVTWWLCVFNSFGIFQQKALLFIVGIFLYLFLVKINAYSKKASLINWIYYPPITFVSIFTALFLIWRSENVTLTNILVFLCSDWPSIMFALKAWLSSEQVLNTFYLIGWLLIMNTFHFLSSFRNKNLSKNVVNKVAVTSESTYQEYEEWFNNDSPISNIQQLSADLKPYAERILSRINDFKDGKKMFHISLCGSFGSGKSSIIKCVANELDSNFIYSNIDTWGTNTKSINAFVLTKVVNDVAQYIDMSTFKSLPSQYIETLKLGNNTSKLLAIFSVISNDPQQGLIKLNDVLNTVNKKLLITIQDVDRCLEPRKATDELGALLDKLKGLSNISFIIALGYESQISETISKVCDYREDLIKVDYKKEFENFLSILNERAIEEGFVIPNKPKYSNILLRGFDPYDIICSQRSFKHICRRVDSIWDPDKLMGEIDLESMCLMIALREEYPLVFDSVIKNSNSLFYAICDKNQLLIENYEGGVNLIDKNKIDNDNTILNECAEFYPSMRMDKLTGFLQYLLDREQSSYQALFHQDSKSQYCDYLKRLLLEKVPDNEVKDQSIFSLFEGIINGDETIDSLIKSFQSDNKGKRWIKVYSMFSRDYFKPTDKSVYEVIYIAMVDFYYKDAIKHNLYSKRLINLPEAQMFLTLLLKECLTNLNAGKLFNITLNIPTIVSFYTCFSDDSIFSREKSCLGFFLNKKEDDNLYDVFVNKLKFDNEITKQLFIIDSDNKSLEWIVKTIIDSDTEVSKKMELWKGIISALIEVNNKTDENYQFDLWFICYVLDSYDCLDKEAFTSNEIESIKSSLNQLNLDDVGDNYLHLSDPKGRLKRVLSALE